MARPTLFTHRKFLRLRALASLSEAHALGHLELLWSRAYASGDAYVGDPTDVELAAGWEGEPGVLCRALLACGGEGRSGFVEEVNGCAGHYRVHDLEDHEPDYVRKRRAREESRKLTGQRRTMAEHDRSLTAERRETAPNGSTPAPAPAPTPTPAHEDAGVREARQPDDEVETTFAEAWALYPNHDGEILAQRAWFGALRNKDIRPTGSPAVNGKSRTVGEVLAAIRAWAACDRWREDGGRFVPSFVRWIEKGGYLNPPPAPGSQAKRGRETAGSDDSRLAGASALAALGKR